MTTSGLSPAARGEGSLYRVIAACQQTFLRVGEIAIGPSYAATGKYGRLRALLAKAK